MDFFATGLIQWAEQEGNLRSFPWRETENPYRIMLAEILLRRTNARSVLPVYLEFIARYPSLTDFRVARAKNIKRLTASLGLSWRAKNLVALSRDLKKRDVSMVPLDLDELLALPGVGPYVARAILINACNKPAVAVDSNVVRVVCRFHGMEMSDNLRRKKSFQEFCDSLISQSRPRLFNYALLDLAASICRPAHPDCNACPLNRSCVYFAEGES